MNRQLDRTMAGNGFVRSARWLAAGTIGGFVTGAVIGGVGGRLAMFVLRLTSSPALHGVPTDDDFTIGIISSATLFLIAFTALTGMLGGLIYLGGRAWLPDRWRPWIWGAATAIVGGAIVIEPGGLDFTALEPLPLAVVMFIAIPAAYGFVLSLVVDRLLRDGSILHRSPLWVFGLVLLVPIALAGPVGLAAILVILGIWLLRRRVPRLSMLWRSVPVTWLGRALLTSFVAIRFVELVGNVQEIL